MVDLTNEQRIQNYQAGRKFYDLLRPDLERNHPGKIVAISVKVGSYVVVDDPKEIQPYAATLLPGDFIWSKRIGEK